MRTATDTPTLLTSREVAERLGVCQATVQRAAREGGLPFVRLRPRGNLLFRSADLDRLVSAADPDSGAVDKVITAGIGVLLGILIGDLIS
jgi:excisionase family DNA binding protein